jgi:hypothetical protein
VILIGDGFASADDFPGDGIVAVLQLDAGTFHLIEDGAEREVIADREWELFELSIEGFARIVAQAGDFTASFLFDGEGFEDVVHIAGLEIEVGGFSGFEVAGAGEKSDSVFEQDDFADGQVGGLGHGQGGGDYRDVFVRHFSSLCFGWAMNE